MPADNRPDVFPKRTPRDLPKYNPDIPNIDKEDSDSDDTIFHWDEEWSLLSDLMEEG